MEPNPYSAWVLMAAIAIGCNVLIGYRSQNVKAEVIMLLILPLLVTIAFFLIADIDSPRGGVIRLNPQNLASLGNPCVRANRDRHIWPTSPCTSPVSNIRELPSWPLAFEQATLVYLHFIDISYAR